MTMKIFMIGGTGLLGYESALRLVETGHQVVSLALPPKQKFLDIPPNMNIIYKNYIHLSDAKIEEMMKGCDAFVFAAGVDERIEGKPPVYEMYQKYNIDPLKRLLPIAKIAGISKVIIFGSYFSYFNRVWEDLHLYDKHPYIKSRINQAEFALSFDSKSMHVCVLELPYIFGVQKGRKPVWIFLVKQLLEMRFATFYPKGGTSMITVKQVSEVVRSILEKEISGNIPIGYYDLTWKEMLQIFHQEMGLKRPIITVPKWMYERKLKQIKKQFERDGIESGLDLNELSDIMSRNAFVEDKSFIKTLDIPEDDIHNAIRESVKLSMEILRENKDAIGMKTE